MIKKISVSFDNGTPPVSIEQSYMHLASLRPNVAWRWDDGHAMSNEDVFLFKKDQHYYKRVTGYFLDLNGIEFARQYVPDFVNPADENRTTLLSYFEEINSDVGRSTSVKYEQTYLGRIVLAPETKILKCLETICVYYTQDYNRSSNNKLYLIPLEDLEDHLKEMKNSLSAWKSVLREFKK